MALLTRVVRLASLAWLGGVAAACDGELPVESLRPIAVSAVGQWRDTLVVRDTVTVTITITDSARRSLRLRTVNWESSDARILTVQPLAPSATASGADSLGARLSALVTARARGRARITVSAEQEGVGRTAPYGLDVTVLEQWIALSAGGTFTCALTVDLDAYCWGAAMTNRWAGLGIGNAGSSGSAVPVPVFGGTKFTAISAGEVHACGVSTAGLIYCWGHNGAGALGDGSFANSLIPVVVTSAQRATSVGAGTEVTCLTSNPASGTYLQQNTFCWGLGEIRGRNPGSPVSCSALGRFSGTCYPRPSDPVESGDIGADPDRAPMPLRAVSAGATHACAIHETTNVVFCWGKNDFGQRGLRVGSAPAWAMPAEGPFLARFRGLAVSAASRHTCAVGIDSLASCWGDNSRGQAGVGRASTTPIDVVTRVASDVKFQSIGAASGWGLSLVTGHSCAVSVAGRMYCWGNNTLGELGRATGDFTRPDTIVTPVGGSVRWKAVAAGGGMLLDEFLGPRPSAHTCGLTDRGAIYCWGGQEAGKLGNGSNNRGGTQVTPIRIAEP